ncbi:MAG TPA: Uma2 family endonuclease [Longimicrobium sp.]|jgi:Uma2 family endonuclease
MATKPAFQHWTYAEFERLPDDGNRYEVIAGELVVSPSPGTQHQTIFGELFPLLKAFVRAHRLGNVLASPTDVLFAEGDYLVPDLLFVRSERTEIISARGVEGPPDLVVEILSPSSTFRDRGIKRERYAHFGVPEYWIIDPRTQHMEVYRLAEDPSSPSVVVSDRFEWQPVRAGPTLAVEMAELFRGLD